MMESYGCKKGVKLMRGREVNEAKEGDPAFRMMLKR